jgi:hypothetical protein
LGAGFGMDSEFEASDPCSASAQSEEARTRKGRLKRFFAVPVQHKKLSSLLGRALVFLAS